ncbi:hypothetical protein S245_040205, partial [Arachis hypogaea]
FVLRIEKNIEFGSAASSRLWIINPRQKESRERPQSPRNTTEAQYRKKLLDLTPLGSCLGKETTHNWNPSEPWERNGGFMLEKLSHSELDWGLDGYCD